VTRWQVAVSGPAPMTAAAASSYKPQANSQSTHKPKSSDGLRLPQGTGRLQVGGAVLSVLAGSIEG
jgi:hypothetical protein